MKIQVWNSLVVSLLLLKANADSKNIAKRHGHEPRDCDDGQHGISIDLHGDSDWKCFEDTEWPVAEVNSINKKCYDQEPAYHVCMDKTIDNLYESDIPHSGPHRKVWAQYGEYTYAPPGRYVHNLEHGGVVFMYHPCAPKEMVIKLRHVATSCLYRYILTAFPKLTKEYPFAVLTYGCIFRMSHVEPTEIKQWIRSMFGKSPEADVYGNGEYTYGLLVPSIERNGNRTTPFCPDLPSDNVVESVQDPGLPVQTQDQEDVLHEEEFDDSIKSKDNLAVAATENNKRQKGSDYYKTDTVDAMQSDKKTDSQTFPKPEKKMNRTNDLNNSSVLTQDEDFSEDPPFGVGGSRTTAFFWVVTAFVCFIIGLLVGVCAMGCRAEGGQDLKRFRVWSDRDNTDSFSIAAVVRKIPDTFTAKNRTQNETYHRLEANDQSSDEDNAV